MTKKMISLLLVIACANIAYATEFRPPPCWGVGRGSKIVIKPPPRPLLEYKFGLFIFQ